MKNKLLIAIIIIGLICAYPIWRYFSNANVFVKSMLNQVSVLGKWTKGSINTSLDGTITIRNLSFIPKNYSQGFDIEDIKISVDPWFLLKSNADKIAYSLPDSLSILVNGVAMNSDSLDLSESLRKSSYWMVLAGYAGSFGCSRDSFTSFDKKTWSKIFNYDQVFNVDFYYSRQQDGSLDVDFIIEAENQFSSTWSSNLKSSYNDEQIIVSELIVDKLFYNYLDYGFNLARNNACKENYNESFASYRLSSAEHLQTYLRSYFSKELPTVLINWYQRFLAPDVEFNTIITLNDRRYLSDVFGMNQRKLYESAQIEVATNENSYLPISLTQIDYTAIDTEILKKENIKREQEKNEEIKKSQQSNTKSKPLIYTTGRSKSRKIPLQNLASVVNKKLRIKTKVGRPITGYLVNVKSTTLSIQTTFKTGSATISIEKSDVASVELLK